MSELEFWTRIVKKLPPMHYFKSPEDIGDEFIAALHEEGVWVVTVELLALALHRYWHTDDAWGEWGNHEQDMAAHRSHAEGILAALDAETRSS